MSEEEIDEIIASLQKIKKRWTGDPAYVRKLDIEITALESFKLNMHIQPQESCKVTHD